MDSTDFERESQDAPQPQEKVLCASCRLRIASVRRRLCTSVGTLGLPELVCGECAHQADDEAERCARGAASVDRAVSQYRKPHAAGVRDMAKELRIAA
jgi:hypothetical protein